MKAIYNEVLEDNDICFKGELFTDSELEELKQKHRSRDWPKTNPTEINQEDIYYIFGARFHR